MIRCFLTTEVDGADSLIHSIRLLSSILKGSWGFTCLTGILKTFALLFLHIGEMVMYHLFRDTLCSAGIELHILSKTELEYALSLLCGLYLIC